MAFLVVVAGLYVFGGAAYNYKATQQLALPHREFCACACVRECLVLSNYSDVGCARSAQGLGLAAWLWMVLALLCKKPLARHQAALVLLKQAVQPMT